MNILSEKNIKFPSVDLTLGLLLPDCVDDLDVPLTPSLSLPLSLSCVGASPHHPPPGVVIETSGFAVLSASSGSLQLENSKEGLLNAAEFGCVVDKDESMESMMTISRQILQKTGL